MTTLNLNETLKQGQHATFYFRVDALADEAPLSDAGRQLAARARLEQAGISADAITFLDDGVTVKIDLTVPPDVDGQTVGFYLGALQTALAAGFDSSVSAVKAVSDRVVSQVDAMEGSVARVSGGIGDAFTKVTDTVTGVARSIPWLVALTVVGVVFIFYSGNVKAKASV